MSNTKRMRRQQRWKLRIFMWGFAAVALLAALAGCGNDTTPRHTQSYGHDGYLGASNSNPNLPNRYSYLNYGSDGKFVRQVLEPIDGIRDVRLSFNGGRLDVDVIAEPSVPDQELERLRAQVHKVVQFNMPRYDVHVDVSQ
ncbi:hypothetical protein ACFSL6_23625 [Paenibacillus thailandensis]|uniref:Sporulation protein n=1 Tax=Paenibacillus thailandensis TaxID=393250 RepID=A0ABW5R2H0_9BACL